MSDHITAAAPLGYADPCPECGCSDHFVGPQRSTMAYYQPKIVDGVNVNPDRNKTTEQRECLKCHCRYQVVY